ncbi:MAG: hypothetical protein M1121_05135 [Actinobacteria bacterium]|nr:hypothetical protein [Actinomycetota bacterium]
MKTPRGSTDPFSGLDWLVRVLPPGNTSGSDEYSSADQTDERSAGGYSSGGATGTAGGEETVGMPLDPLG